MSDDEVMLEISMPLDSDGFLRRECPTCEREFKWLHTLEKPAGRLPRVSSAGSGRRSPVAGHGEVEPGG